MQWLKEGINNLHLQAHLAGLLIVGRPLNPFWQTHRNPDFGAFMSWQTAPTPHPFPAQPLVSDSGEAGVELAGCERSWRID